MKLGRTQVCVLLVTVLLLTATIGYRAGSGNSEATFSVSVQRQAPVSDVMRGGDEKDESGDSDGNGLIGQEPKLDSFDSADPAEHETEGNGSDSEEIGSININVADLEELKTLPGIGDVLASRILEYREKNGDFARISDILDVKGIGVAIYDKIRPHISIGGEV